VSQPPFEQNESIALIIDTSSSALAGIDAARQTAQVIHGLIGSEQFKFFMLGSATPIPPAALRQAAPPGVKQQAQACSLIAPIMETLVCEEQKHSVIIIGNGEIFDLDDWTNDPRVDSWLLVQTGKQSLQGSPGRVSEITLDQIMGDADTLLSYFSRPAREPEETPKRDYDAGQYEWRVDASGYPLIFVEPIRAFVHLFPVTKPQFEKFMVASRRPDYGDEWYTRILDLNPRASYRSTDISSREHLFMTGVTTDEAASFSRWLGRDYGLLSADEWNTCYEWFVGQPAPSAPLDLLNQLSRDALALWELVEGQWLDHRRRANLRELSLMTQGILEWVIERPGRYCGLGKPATSKFQRRANDPVRPLGQEPRRHKGIGFRLLAR
jgi:hypothetical protein